MDGERLAGGSGFPGDAAAGGICDAAGVYQWNVILQGTDKETVFFDY